MAVLSRLTSAVRGALWLARGDGLREQVQALEKQLDVMHQRLLDVNHKIGYVFDRAFDNADVQGHTMALDPCDSLALARNGIYEPFETELVKRHVRKGDVVLDIGANIGYFTLILARLVGDEGKVFAFEPDPSNFALLKRNVERNGYGNVVPVNKAVSNRTESAWLFLSQDNKGDHRLYDSHDGRDSVAIDAVRLDDYFEQFPGKIDFIKMDVQGAEGGAIEGMAGLLQRSPQVKMITEFWPIGLKRFGVEAAVYLQRLRNLGFQLFQIKDEEKRLEHADCAALLRDYPADREEYANLFCVRE